MPKPRAKAEPAPPPINPKLEAAKDAHFRAVAHYEQCRDLCGLAATNIRHFPVERAELILDVVQRARESLVLAQAGLGELFKILAVAQPPAPPSTPTVN